MRRASLKRGILALVIVAVGAAQGLAIAFGLAQEAQRYAASKKELLLSEARILAAAVSSAVAARDAPGVYVSLRAAGQLSDISFVSVDDPRGNRIAGLGAAERLSSDLEFDASSPVSPLDLLRSHSFALRAPIVYGGRIVGRIVLIGDAREFKQSLESTFLVSAVTLGGSLLTAVLIALRMQGALTGPIAALVRAMKSVAASHDYSLSLPATRISEVAALVDGFNRMLSEIRERDAKIARSYAELEQQVLDRTTDLRAAKEAAETARASAEEANAQKSEFLATMSHEIRTPMNGMLVMAELLAESKLPARSQRYADVIWRSGKSLLAIINDILDLSKIEAGKLELERTSVDIGDLATTVLDLFGASARSKGVDLAARVATDGPRTIIGDPVRLTQVLTNLVNNALKFTERGGVNLVIEPDAADPLRLRFTVEDTGIGIPEDKLESVFSAFSQADMTTTRKYGGTGLGLAICRRLVEAMGAEISVVSNVGKGSAFSFSLRSATGSGADWPRRIDDRDLAPRAVVCIGGEFTRRAFAYYLTQTAIPFELVESAQLAARCESGSAVIADARLAAGSQWEQVRRSAAATILIQPPDQEPLHEGLCDVVLSWPLARGECEAVLAALAEGRPLQHAAPKSGAPANSSYAGRRALVADDSEINQEVAREALQRLGIAVEVVGDGLQAVTAFTQATFDLVFLDGSMPVMDGFDACRAIRQYERDYRRPRTPVVALTAHVLGARSDAWVESGMDALLTKPFTLADLHRCIAGLLGEAPQKSQPEGLEAAVEPTPLEELLDKGIIAELGRRSAPGATDFVRRVIGLYLEHAPKAVAHIQEVAERQDLPALAKAAHSLRSMSLNIGARAVASCASTLEQRAKDTQAPTSAEIVQVGELVDATCLELRAVFQTARSAA